jgi:hypothetical protein
MPPAQKKGSNHYRPDPLLISSFNLLAGPTRLELATSGVTGQRSNRLNYDPVLLVQNTAGRKKFLPLLLVGGTGIEPVTPGL